MRLSTTSSLIHLFDPSNGFFPFLDISESKLHSWNIFWSDQSLGTPVGKKGEQYRDVTGNVIQGLFIREFEEGWVVHNRSGQSQQIRLPERCNGWSSGVENKHWHTLPDLDGEIYLKIPPTMDINGDGIVNILDLVAVANGFGTDTPDVNADGVVNILDLVAVANAFGQ